jgi:hypothetical protein
MKMIARWPSADPEAQAELLKVELERAYDDILGVRLDRHVPEPPRFASRDGLMVSRWICEKAPEWRIGYTEQDLMLMIDYPDIKAVRQRRRSLLRWDTQVVNDTEREDRIYRRVAEAASCAGLNPYEANVDWNVI